jgi:hypothetical protein
LFFDICKILYFLLTFCEIFSKTLTFVPELLQTGTFVNFYLRRQYLRGGGDAVEEGIGIIFKEFFTRQTKDLTHFWTSTICKKPCTSDKLSIPLWGCSKAVPLRQKT